MAEPNATPDLEARLADALATISTLRSEIERLQRLAEPARLELTPVDEVRRSGTASTIGGLDAHSSEASKVGMFRRLFRGRDDVYAYRWEGRDGKTGYSPALRPGIRRQKGQRPDVKALLPLDDEANSESPPRPPRGWHLSVA